MLCRTEYSVNLELLKQAATHTAVNESKVAINQPTGDFFYDPWVIKSEFQNTIFEKVLNSLPETKGEARIITLKPGTSYFCHSDADDRWHLNLRSEYSYLCDLEHKQLYELKPDGIWYDMDAGRLHTAANFGNRDRIQLVVRKLLLRNILRDPINVLIKPEKNIHDFRYQFDKTISPWLNRANKNKTISNFIFVDNSVKFKLEKDCLPSLKNVVPSVFKIIL